MNGIRLIGPFLIFLFMANFLGLMVGGCGDRGPHQETTAVSALLSEQDLLEHSNQGVFLYAIRQDTGAPEEVKQLALLLRPSSKSSPWENLPNGDWKFYALGLHLPHHPLSHLDQSLASELDWQHRFPSGFFEIKCGLGKNSHGETLIHLDGVEAQIQMDFNEENCLWGSDSIFGKKEFSYARLRPKAEEKEKIEASAEEKRKEKGGPNWPKLFSCGPAELNSITLSTQTCEGSHNKYGYYKIGLAGYKVWGNGEVEWNEEHTMFSDCLKVDGRGTLAPFPLPVGHTRAGLDTPFAVVIQKFSRKGCDKSGLVHQILGVAGLSSLPETNPKNVKIFSFHQNQAASTAKIEGPEFPHQTRIYLSMHATRGKRTFKED